MNNFEQLEFSSVLYRISSTKIVYCRASRRYVWTVLNIKITWCVSLLLYVYSYILSYSTDNTFQQHHTVPLPQIPTRIGRSDCNKYMSLHISKLLATIMTRTTVKYIVQVQVKYNQDRLCDILFCRHCAAAVVVLWCFFLFFSVILRKFLWILRSTNTVCFDIYIHA